MKAHKRQRGRERDGVPVAGQAGVVRIDRGEVAAVHVEEADQADQQHGYELQHRCHERDDARLANAGDVRQRQHPDQAQADGEREHVVGAQAGPEHRGVADEDDRNGRVAGPGGDPVAPRRPEAGEVTECPPCVDVRATGLRICSAEVGEHQRQQDRAGAGDHPREQRDRADAGQGRRQAEHARPDHVSDHQCSRHRQPQRPLQRWAGRLLARGHYRHDCFLSSRTLDSVLRDNCPPTGGSPASGKGAIPRRGNYGSAGS